MESVLQSAGVRIMTDVIERFGKIRIFGSQALHLCYVAAGRLRLAASVEAKLWDDAAGALIVTESGRTILRPERPIAVPSIPTVRSGTAEQSAAWRPTLPRSP